MTDWIPADWPAPAHIHAGTTTRLNGASRRPFDSFNLAAHVGDRPDAVAGNRRQLRDRLDLPAEPAWLQQQHGNRVIRVKQGRGADADGAYTDTAGEVCAVLTADCVPLLLCNRNGAGIAALHIGWRGLCSRVIRSGLSMLDAAPRDLLAWIGPHLRQKNYEVGADVVSACLKKGLLSGDGDRFETCSHADPQEYTPVPYSQAVSESRTDHWFLNLGALVKNELQQLGVADVYDSNQCTYANKDLFYSWRRDGMTGRMASLIWMDGEKNC